VFSCVRLCCVLLGLVWFGYFGFGLVGLGLFVLCWVGFGEAWLGFLCWFNLVWIRLG
jgi:hypothetical protein